MSKLTGFLDKIKNNKKLQIGVVALLLIALIAIFGSTLLPKSKSSKEDSKASNQYDYADLLENKLAKTLSNIKDAGKVSVMITLDGGAEIEIAYTIEERVNNSTGSSNSQESSTIVKTPVLITQNGVTKPVILSEKNPPIKGVIVVASGASNARVKIDILRAAVAVLDIEASMIEIFAGEA